ncbi:Hypothetical protein A7982_00680 [Minicystis rosea]|nr:Hypothetical protein A7982_00680 [Minicystis rosea]
MIAVVTGDVLAVEADALVVPIDGTMQLVGAGLERILGNVGRQFQRRWPEADLIEALEAQIDLPMALGKAAPVEMENAPFRVVVVVSTLHHAQPLDERAKVAVARTAFANTLDQAVRAGVKRLATTVLQGGWRLTPQAAFGAMLQAILQAQSGELDVTVACLDEALTASLEGQARSVGLLKSDR